MYNLIILKSLSKLILGIFITIFSYNAPANDIVYNPPVELNNVSLAKTHSQANFSRGVRGLRGLRGEAGFSTGVCETVDKDFSLRVLVPGAGFTTAAQPNLYWSISKPVSATLVVTLIPVVAPDSFDYPEPLIDTTVNRAVNAGINMLSLADHKVSLETNREYEWSVSIICDPKNLSLSINATGKIKRIIPSPDLATQIKAANQEPLVSIYANNGIWYDAFDVLSQLINQSGNNEKLRNTRVSLLKSVGIE